MNDKESLLHEVIETGNAERIKALLDEGINPNARDKCGRTALHKAAWEGYSEVSKALLASGAKVNARDKNGATPLHMAVVHYASPEFVQTLLDVGAHVNARTRETGATPLLVAILVKTSKKVIELLIDAGADVNAEDKSGQTLLSWAKERLKCLEHSERTNNVKENTQPLLEAIKILRAHGARE